MTDGAPDSDGVVSAVPVPPHPPRLNIPNAFTFLRVVLVPVVLWLLTLDGESARWWAFAVFVFAAWTDSLDGWVARRFGTVTRWGQLADPIADKLLVLGTLASLAVVAEVAWWAVLVILARELAVTLLRIGLVRRRRLVLPASIWGKVKTITQIVAVSAYLAPVVAQDVAEIALWVAVVATILSGAKYVVDIRRGVRADDDV